MELTKAHRDALIQELESALEDERRQIEGVQTYNSGEKKDDELLAFFDVGLHLAKMRIEAIKKSLIDNELFNF